MAADRRDLRSRCASARAWPPRASWAPSRCARGLATVEVFDHFCRATGIDEVEAVATSAIRDAVQPRRLPRRGRRCRCGFSRRRRRRTSATSRRSTRRRWRRLRARPRRRIAAAHAGGGAAGGRGALMAARRGADDRALRRRSQGAAQARRGGDRGVSGERLVAIGGTARNLAAADQRLRSLPSFGVQGHVIPRDALAALVEELAGRSPAQRGKLRRDQARARRHHPRGRADDPHRARQRRVRRRRGDRGGAARGRVLLPLAGAVGAVRRRPPPVGAEPRRALPRGPRAHRARRAAGARPVRRARRGRPARRRSRRARAAVGRGDAPRHRHDRRLRRPSQALALPAAQRRPAGLHPARGRADRPGRPLPPQGRTGRSGRSGR